MRDESDTAGLIDKIRRDAEEEARAIVEKAEKIRADRETSHSAWEKRERRSWEKREKEFAREREERLDASFRMEKKKLFLRSREGLMQRIEEEAMHRIEDAQRGPAYREYLKDWTVEGVLGLREEDILLKGSRADLEIMDPAFLAEVREEVSRLTGLAVSLRTDRETPQLVPGVLLETADGRVSFNNQLPARFRRMKAQIRQGINSALKEGEPPHE